MHPLHDYVVKQLAEKLKSRKVVVWYDVRREFAPFIAEVRGGARTSNEAVSVTVAGLAARLAEYDGSMFELRAVVEPLRLRGCAGVRGPLPAWLRTRPPRLGAHGTRKGGRVL